MDSNMTRDRSREGLAATYLHYASDEFNGYAPLYQAIALRIAEDAALLDISADAPVGQLPPNLLFAAVHYLLLGGQASRLGRYYQSLTDQPLSPEDAFPEFRDFCLQHEDEIRHLIRTRLVQTNEVGRSACLLPAFLYVSQVSDSGPLALIDIGAAAGLNLLFDRYYFDYGEQSWGRDDSPVRLKSELRDSKPLPLKADAPVVAYRAGLDLNPIDVTDDDAVRWLQALLWPEQPQRAALLKAALEVAKADPPQLFQGDAVELLPGVIETIDPGLTLCIYHSFALGYFPPEARERFRGLVAETAQRRRTYFVEMTGTALQAHVRLTSWSNGEPTTVQLAGCAAHGQWLRWLV